MSTTPTEAIRDADTTLRAWGEADLRARVDGYREAIDAARELVGTAADLHAAAMRAYVAEVGATAAAKELGISRNRVYVVMRHGSDG